MDLPQGTILRPLASKGGGSPGWLADSGPARFPPGAPHRSAGRLDPICEELGDAGLTSPEVLSQLLSETGLGGLPGAVEALGVTNSALAALFFFGFVAPRRGCGPAGNELVDGVSPAAAACPASHPESRPFTDEALRAAILAIPGFELPFGGPVPNAPYCFSDSWAAGLCGRSLHLHFKDPNTWKLLEWAALQPWGLPAIYEGLPPMTAFDLEPFDDKLLITLSFLESLPGARLDSAGAETALGAVRRNSTGWGFGPEQTEEFVEALAAHFRFLGA